MRIWNPTFRSLAELKAFNQRIDDPCYATLVGLPVLSANVLVEFMRPWKESDTPPPVTLRRRDDVASITLRFLGEGTCDLSTFMIADPGQGVGRTLLCQIFAAVRKLGLRQVQCVGKRLERTLHRREVFGYYAMPRFGFDTVLPDEVRLQLPSAFLHCKSISELLATRAGRRYWLVNGVTLRGLAFDLTESSRSWTTLQDSI